VKKWPIPTTVTALRDSLGLCNYYSTYVRMLADLAASLKEKLKLPQDLGKAGNKHFVTWIDD
jgi:hypothetical protein